jgi:hypothetical protein
MPEQNELFWPLLKVRLIEGRAKHEEKITQALAAFGTKRFCVEGQ